jgi:hypothetical protein
MTVAVNLVQQYMTVAANLVQQYMTVAVNLVQQYMTVAVNFLVVFIAYNYKQGGVVKFCTITNQNKAN